MPLAVKKAKKESISATITLSLIKPPNKKISHFSFLLQILKVLIQASMVHTSFFSNSQY